MHTFVKQKVYANGIITHHDDSESGRSGYQAATLQILFEQPDAVIQNRLSSVALLSTTGQDELNIYVFRRFLFSIFS